MALPGRPLVPRGQVGVRRFRTASAAGARAPAPPQAHATRGVGRRFHVVVAAK